MGFAASWVQNVTAVISGNRLSRHLRARWQQRYAVLAIFALAALVWFYRSLDWCGSNVDGYSICGVDIDQAIYQLIYDFQNLITGLLALVAAYITTRPMRRQLAFMAMQSAVMTRGEIAQALSDVESRRKDAKQHREKISLLESQLHDEGEPVPISSKWAESSGAVARAFRRHMKQDRNELRDPSALNVKKRELEQALEKLEQCLARIRVHTPSDFHEEGLDADQIRRIIEDERTDSEQAAGELHDHFSRVSTAMRALWVSYGQRIIELRSLLRSIDDSIQRRAQIEADNL